MESLMSLTDLTIKALKPPERGQITYTDDTIPGFGVRVSQGGVKSFVLVHGRNRQRTTIGRVGIVSLKDARATAKRILAERTLGKQTSPSVSFEEALKLFLSTHYGDHHLKPRTKQETERLLNKHFLPKLRYERLEKISTHTVAQIVDGLLKTPSEANHAFAAIRLFFRWATRRRYILHSPCEPMQMPTRPRTKDRVLNDQELSAVWRAAEGTFGDIVKLLILTGQRCNEIANLHTDFIGPKTRTITLPAWLTKNKREHRFPFGKMTGKLLKAASPETGLIFPARGKTGKAFSGWSKSKKALDTKSPIAPWTLHDLRRTFATNLAALGVPVHITEKLLNHVSGTTGGIVAVYQRHVYEDEMRTAVRQWERHLAKILNLR